MSSSLRSRRSPKPGARTATHWKIRLTWLCTSMLSAVPSTFSAMMTSGRGARMILSSSGISCWTLVIFSLHSRMYGSSSDRLQAGRVGHQVRREVAVVELEALDEVDAHPVGRDSSTVTMPPSPTVCSALAITAPTASSSLAEIAATRA